LLKRVLAIQAVAVALTIALLFLHMRL